MVEIIKVDYPGKNIVKYPVFFFSFPFDYPGKNIVKYPVFLKIHGDSLSKTPPVGIHGPCLKPKSILFIHAICGLAYTLLLDWIDKACKSINLSRAIYSGQKKRRKFTASDLQIYPSLQEWDHSPKKILLITSGKKYFDPPGPLTFFFWPLYIEDFGMGYHFIEKLASMSSAFRF